MLNDSNKENYFELKEKKPKQVGHIYFSISLMKEYVERKEISTSKALDGSILFHNVSNNVYM